MAKISRADNSISFRIDSVTKHQYQLAAQADQMTLTLWLKKLAEKRIEEQSHEQN